MAFDAMRMNRAVVILVLAAAGMVGCARIPLAPPQPTMQSLEVLREPGVAPMAVGDFQLAAGQPAALDKSLDVRGNAVQSPYGESFSAYLKEVLITELRAAGKLDPASSVVVSARLDENVLEASGISVNRGAVAATFEVRKGGAVVYERQFKEQAEWPSSFIGAIAIPTAVSQYAALFKKLVGQLVTDPAFGRATAMGG